MSGIEIATGLLNEFTEIKVKELFAKRPWMEGKKFTLLTSTIEVEKYIDECIQKGLCALDLETTSLNTRLDKNGESCAKIVGVCLSTHPDEGVYIPVLHEDKEFNVPTKFIVRELKRLVANCRCIFHNFKYDGQVLRNYGIIIEDESKYEDTYLMAAVQDASRKEKGLKFLSNKLCGREMIEINELGIQGSKKNVVAFDMVPPQKAVYYGGSDGMCTFALYERLKALLDEQDPTHRIGPWNIYRIEKRCLFVTMEMERNMAKIDRVYLEQCRVEVIDKIKRLVKNIHEIAGREFDINSPKQLGVLLFEEMKIPYPAKEKTASGQYKTDEKTIGILEGKYPIIDMILAYRGLEKILETYIENFLRNADENDEVKFNLNQVQADTGRFSSSGGSGLHADGYSGVNCQNIPNPNEDNPDSIDLRRAVIVRPGYKMVSADYSGEELRVAANYSREPKWIEEFNHGSADMHTKTAMAVSGKTKVSKQERKNAKILNFHILYGGGAGGFAARAKIPFEVAKKMLINYFSEFSQLKRWIDAEVAVSRKRGYSLTVLGRRRSLTEFYTNPDKKIQAKGDRCAVNSAIQGASADLIKIALYRVWKWVREKGLQDDVRILAPIHDEILFEIKEEKLFALIPEICDIMRMRDITDALKWPVPLEVDAEYGDSFHVDHNYWEEVKSNQIKVPEKTPAVDSPETVAEEPSEVQESIPPVVQEQTTPVEESAIEEVSAEMADKPTMTMTMTKENPVASNTSTEATQYYVNITVKHALTDGVEDKEAIKRVLKETVESKDSQPLFQDAHTKDRIDQKGFFNYPMEIDSVSARKVKFIFETLIAAGDSVFIGPKNKVCLLSKDGEMFYKSSEAISVDAFLALCLAFNI